MGVATTTYTPLQAEVYRLHDLYRNCSLSRKYYAHRLKQYKRWNLTFDIVTALATSSAFAGLAIWQTPVGVNVFSILLAASVIISVLRPLLKLSDGVDRYSKLHYAYGELFYQIESLVAEMRRKDGVRDEHLKAAAEMADRYGHLGLQDDPGPNRKALKKFQDEVNQAIPPDRLWLPRS
ncbi:MAG: hypothetical protein HY647_05635 [Acidobacteria bacterium]|nr:hypothetical protein [Acidobacteriota bacterium]